MTRADFVHRYIIANRGAYCIEDLIAHAERAMRLLEAKGYTFTDSKTAGKKKAFLEQTGE